jgi:hypothetical protein
MCNAVIDGDRAYCTPEELGTLVGADNLVWQDHNPFSKWPAEKDWRVMDMCLCPIDLKKSLDRAGFQYKRGIDPMEWFIVG